VGRGGEAVVVGAVVVVGLWEEGGIEVEGGVTEVEGGGTEEEGSRSMSLASCMPAGGGICVPGWGGGGAMPLLPGGGPGGGGGKVSSALQPRCELLRDP